MQSKRSTKKPEDRRVISLVAAEEEMHELDRKLIEAMERIEAVRTKAALAVGSLLAAGR